MNILFANNSVSLTHLPFVRDKSRFVIFVACCCSSEDNMMVVVDYDDLMMMTMMMMIVMVSLIWYSYSRASNNYWRCMQVIWRCIMLFCEVHNAEGSLDCVWQVHLQHQAGCQFQLPLYSLFILMLHQRKCQCLIWQLSRGWDKTSTGLKGLLGGVKFWYRSWQILSLLFVTIVSSGT